MGIEISEKQFEETVRKSDRLVLVYFHLPSCAKCGTWNGVAEGLVRDSGGKVQLVKLNVAENQGLASQLNVLGAPSFIVFRAGEEVERFVGERVNYEDMYVTIGIEGMFRSRIEPPITSRFRKDLRTSTR